MSNADTQAGSDSTAGAGDGPVTVMTAPIRLEYTIGAGTAQSRFLRGLLAGRILGQRCPACGRVYCPPRGACPTDAVPTEEEVELPDTGTVTTFCVVNIRFTDRAPEVPYVCAQVLLDGADTPLLALVAGVPAAEVHMGQRVRAVWVPPEERRPTLENIKWFEPTGEPDADFDSYRGYL
jgi:uncharacterized protein